MAYFIELKDNVIVSLQSNKQDGFIPIHDNDVQLVLDYIKQTPNKQERRELKDIQRWLNANDYKVNKHLLGEYQDNDERWTSYLQARQDKLARYNELEAIIASGELPAFDVSLLTPLPEPEVVEELVEETLEEDVNFTYEEIEAAKLKEEVEEDEEDETVEDTETTDTEL
jgi:hypothetical protein